MQSHCTGFNSQGMVGGDIRREGVGNREKVTECMEKGLGRVRKEMMRATL